METGLVNHIKQERIMKKIITIFIALFMLISCQKKEDITHVSINELLIIPSSFDGNVVRIKGYLAKVMQGQYNLYPYQEDYSIKDQQKAIYIEAGGFEKLLDKCKLGYVEVIGTFVKYSGKKHTNKLFEIISVRYRNIANEYDGYSPC